MTNDLMKVIKVSNGTNEYYGNFTKKEQNIIYKNIIGYTLNLFSGKSQLGNIRIDYKYGNLKMDVFQFIDLYTNNQYFSKEYDKFDTIIIDAPYNQKFADKYQKIGNTPKQFIIFADTKRTTILFNWLKEIKPKIIIIKSWNYYILKNYHLKEGYLCYAGGYRKPTILEILEVDK